MFVHNWNSDVNDSTRARCYVVYANFRFQPYLSLINIQKVCVSLSRFRVSVHRLEIETIQPTTKTNWNLSARWNKCRTYFKASELRWL